MRHNIVSLKLKYNQGTTEYRGIFFTVLTVEQNQWYCATLLTALCHCKAILQLRMNSISLKSVRVLQLYFIN